MDGRLIGLWYVCALGGIVFAAGVAPSRGARVAFAVSFAAAASAFMLMAPAMPDVALAGGVAAIAAAWLLLREARPWVWATLAGVLSGAWVSALEAQGLHRAIAIGAALAAPVTAMRLAARRPQFVTPVMREEALIFVCLLGAVAALAPGVADGCQAAVNLNLTSGAGDASLPSPMLPAWTLGVTGTALSVGALYTIWSRR